MKLLYCFFFFYKINDTIMIVTCHGFFQKEDELLSLDLKHRNKKKNC